MTNKDNNVHEICIFSKGESLGLLAIANNFVANFKPDSVPNVLFKEFETIQKAKKQYILAIESSEDKWWQIVYRGKPLYG